MESPDTQLPSIALEKTLLEDWCQRHVRGGATPSVERLFASIETSLVLEPLIAESLTPSARRARICLPSLGRGKAFGRFEVGAVDLERWGVWNRSSEFVRFADWYPLIRYLAEKQLLEDYGEWREEDEYVDPRVRKPFVPRRQVRLRGLPLATNRRSAATKRRSNETLSEGVGTFVVPKSLFMDDRLSRLSPTEFITLMAVYALTDMEAFGGADPAHIGVIDGRFGVSLLVSLSVARPDDVLTAAKSLEQQGFLRFVPVKVSSVCLPSALPTIEVVRESESSSSFVLRPTVVYSKKAKPVVVTKELDQSMGGPAVLVTVESAWPLRVVASVKDALPQVPQYSQESFAAVVSDRAVQNYKMRVAQALHDCGFHCSDISLGLADDGLMVGLVHAAKATLDAMRSAKTITGDSMYVVNRLDVRRVPVTKRGLPHVEVDVTPVDKSGRFSRRLYIDALEWRPPARRGPSFLTGWPSYAAYIDAIERASASVGDLVLNVQCLCDQPVEMSVYVSAPSGCRFDPDNVALFACDLLTVMLTRRGLTCPVDRFVDRVIVTHGEGEHSVALEIRPLQK